MEEVKRKNERLEILLDENKLLRQQTQEKEKQVAELKQELEGDEYLHDFVVPLSWKYNLFDTYRERKSNEKIVH